MNNKVNNPEVNVSKTINMNEKNYLEVILENEKNMSNNLSIAIDEASNDLLLINFMIFLMMLNVLQEMPLILCLKMDGTL